MQTVEPVIQLQLPVSEVNFVLGLVGKQPYDQAAGLIDKIRGQAAPQLVAFAPYYHMVAETGPISSPSIEPDALVLVRVFRDAAHVNDTCTNGVFGFTADIHYQSDRHSTLNHAPNFYGN